MRVEVSLTENEWIEVGCFIQMPGFDGKMRRHRMSTTYFTEGEVYSLLPKLKRVLLELKGKQ
jgi:hypothetical protein